MRAFLVTSLLLVGCAHQPDAKKDTHVAGGAGTQGSSSAGGAGPGGGGRSCNADTDCGARQLCIRNQCVDITADLAECQTMRVHFDFDAAEIRDDDRASIERMARCLKADQHMHVTVEGNADERGTDEYNMALGDKRANAVEKYLERLGVSATQLRAVSYGKERPLCAEHDEQCWSTNRRAAVRTAR